MKNNLETAFVQLGNRSDITTGAVNPPLYLSTAYAHPGIGESTGYDYTRTKNPTRTVLEEGFAELEKGDRAFACSSGMAAIQLVLSLFRSGDELLVPEDIYGGTYRLFDFYEEAYDIKPIYSPFRTVEETAAAITANTKAIFLETPTNPLMQEFSIAAYSELAKNHNLLLVVDNTFLTPYLQQPIADGADIVIHSATKYIGGHNDVLAGLVVSKGTEISDRLAVLHNGAGAVLSPLDAWLLIRGLKTLPLRMRQHQSNAARIAAYLEEEPKVKDVLYAGKGGMLSFRVQNGSWIDPFLRSLNVITFAESLGGVESFITYPTTQTHADIPVDEREARGICDRLLRFSVGIEDAEDLIADLQQAFANLD
ncbi:cysteine synthase /cystathionine gamma-synthase [Terribacillus aidingensis]|uniref:Cysteine synthase /cystathionine gamma-synthase n=1 Tax=Terribacillus aidingensis TaxID=586416 RepID=A0A285P087_9BACI|nr:methionine biosynthesis PLP-dependent protein [Terribacillus aidingensis]SNZ14687.1 cysteine synthase /cystathionine gamma-synthase [Terribacillus aidingensis]